MNGSLPPFLPILIPPPFLPPLLLSRILPTSWTSVSLRSLIHRIKSLFLPNLLRPIIRNRNKRHHRRRNIRFFRSIILSLPLPLFSMACNFLRVRPVPVTTRILRPDMDSGPLIREAILHLPTQQASLMQPWQIRKMKRRFLSGYPFGSV